MLEPGRSKPGMYSPAEFAAIVAVVTVLVGVVLTTWLWLG